MAEWNLNELLRRNPDLSALVDDPDVPPQEAIQSEEDMQIILMGLLSSLESKYPELTFLFHPPNGGLRHPAVAAKMRAQGVKPGVPDIMFPLRRGNENGIAIELKFGSNDLTPAQTHYLQHLIEQGWRAKVCWDVEEAFVAIQDYLRGNPD